jgi:hypothetical protein
VSERWILCGGVLVNGDGVRSVGRRAPSVEAGLRSLLWVRFSAETTRFAVDGRLRLVVDLDNCAFGFAMPSGERGSVLEQTARLGEIDDSFPAVARLAGSDF